MAHDVTRELRDWHGRWRKGNAARALKRMTEEAGGEFRGPALSHPEVKAGLEAIPMNGGKRINGVPVGRSKKGFYIALTSPEGKRDSKNYQSSHHAARAVIEGKHNHEEGPITEAGPGSPPLSAPPEHPIPFSGKWNADNEHIKGTPEHTFHRLMDSGVGSMAAKRLIYHAYNNGESETEEGLFVRFDKDTGKYSVHVFKPEPKPEEPFRKAVRTGGVAHPKELNVKVQASAEDKKRMRQQVLKATSLQGEVTPALVEKTAITVTKAPHGKRGTSTLASHTGQGNTLHVKPEVLIGDNAQAVLDHNAGNWWVPTNTKKHDLATNVMTHEFGHGIHGELMKRGIITTTRHSPRTGSEQEWEFWRGFANALKRSEAKHSIKPTLITEPRVIKDQYGVERMDVYKWMTENAASLRKQISRYGASNQNEMFAELWTEYRLSDSPRPVAKYFGDYVMKALGGTG